jgi:hypothetical protein
MILTFMRTSSAARTGSIDRFRPPELDGDGLALDITELAQAGAQRLDSLGVGSGEAKPQESDARDVRGLLRPRRQRPRDRRAAEQRDEVPPLHHSITVSARKRNESAIVRPSVLAVLRLITSSNFVGCSTGISAGFPPCKTLTTNVAARRNESGPSRP